MRFSQCNLGLQKTENGSQNYITNFVASSPHLVSKSLPPRAIKGITLEHNHVVTLEKQSREVPHATGVHD